MVSANKNISLSSLKVFLNLKIFCFILICILCIFILILTGCCEILKLSDCCPWELYKAQVNKMDLESVDNEIKEKKIKDEDKKKIDELIKVLKSRSNPKIVRNEKGERYIRYDLEDFIVKEKLKGWEYLKDMPMTPYSSDINGRDGLLVRKRFLPVYNPGVPIVYNTNSKHGVKLSFIHLSDVQLRDERVYMFSKKLTRFLDYFSDGFWHEPELVVYDHSYYLTLTGVMMRLKHMLNSEDPKLKPKFMIHTGDVAHMGVVSEHYEFICITNNLEIPWYDVLGNHDYPVYGNLSPEGVGVINPNMGFQTLSSRYNFINMHGQGFEIDPMVYFSPENAPHTPNKTTDQPDNDPDQPGSAPDQKKRSIYNGFDMRGAESVVEGNDKKPCKQCSDGSLCQECSDGSPCIDGKCSGGDPCGVCPDENPCKECPGYYHFEALQPEGNDPGILAVVIDTSVEDFHFAKGSVCRNKNAAESKNKDKCGREQREQIDWLENVLEKYANEGNWMVLAFGHHPLSRESFYDESYKEVTDLFHNPRYNVIAYFCGHTHKHRVQYRRNGDHPGTFGFWEITTDSILEYPKKGSLVNIVYTDENYWAITLQSFWPYFLDGDLPIGVPDIDMLQNAKKCFEASKVDDEGRKKKRYDTLPAWNHDAVLPFTFPKVK
jgi:hypothetical protein